MADYFLSVSLLASLVLLGIGGFLLSDSITHSSPSQSLELIVAAQILAFGLSILYSQGKRALRRVSAARRHYRDDYL